MRPYFLGKVCKSPTASPSISAASFTSSRTEESVVAKQKGIHILSTLPIIAPSVKINTNPNIAPTTKLPIKGSRLKSGVYKAKRGKTKASAIC